MSEEIINIKEQIANLKEYLNSDTCQSCGETAIKLEEYLQKLKKLLNQNDTNS